MARNIASFALAGLCGLAGVAAPGLAPAQQTTLAPSAAVACLTPPPAERGQPEYPVMHYKSGTPGRVLASATFDETDWLPGPTIQIDQQEGGEEFVSAVQAHLRTLRVPCLPKGGKATLQFDFVFNPNSPRVFWKPPVDAADRQRQASLNCVIGVAGDDLPAYPWRAREIGLQGRVWASLRYSAPDQPPEVKLHHRHAGRSLAPPVREWLANRRMPCHQGEPVDAEVTFVFRLGDEVFGFKPMGLVQLMGSVKGIGKESLALDTTAMGCPFDLKLTYRQPDAPNKLGQLGDYNPARQPLLDWLAGITLNLPPESLDSVYGDTADIHVPCVKINLKPKEKTP